MNHAFHFNGQDKKVRCVLPTQLAEAVLTRISPTEEGFSRTLVLGLIEALELDPLSDLTPNEQAHLLVLIQTTLEVSRRCPHLPCNSNCFLG
jgi:hypothetical protein